MKLPILSLLIIFTICSNAQGQKIRYSDNTNKWSLTYDPTVNNTTITQQYIKDTIVNGLYYSQLASKYNKPWIREDTMQGKVFYTTNFNNPDVLLYDYNLTVGDTLVSYHQLWDTTTFILIGLDTVQINGYDHIVQSFSSDSMGIDAVVIEGIGCLEEAFALIPHHPNPGIIITCFENKGVRPSITPHVGILDNTSSCLLMSVDDPQTTLKAKVIPQPANETSKLLFSARTSGTLTITDCLGRLVVRKPFEHTEEISLGKYLELPGVYYYQVYDIHSDTLNAGKIVYNIY